MKKFKKAALTAASYVSVAALAVGGTLALFTSEDSDVNTMSIGNVKIEQIEQEWNEDKTELVDFTQGKALYPYVGELGWDTTVGDEVRRFTMDNVVDKYISVKNTGRASAYVRTVLAFEMGDYSSVDEFRNKVIGVSRNDEDGVEFDFDDTWKWGTPFVGKIDGKNYMIWEVVYQQALNHNETTIPSLLQVYMNKDMDNEDVESFGDTYEIYAISQAVQTDGFEDAATALETAFGKISVENHPWLQSVAADADSFAKLAKEGGTVILTEDIALPEVLEVNDDIQIIANGNTITAPEDGTRVINVQDNDEDVNILIQGAVVAGADKERGISFYNNTGALNVDIIDSEIESKYGVNVASNNTNAVLNIKDSTLSGFCAFQTWSPNTIATFDNCVLNGVNKWEAASGIFATIVINPTATNSKLTFNDCTITAQALKDAKEYHYIDNAEGTEIIWNNCTFQDIAADGTVTEVDNATTK